MNPFQKAVANIPNQPNVFQKALQSARSSTPPLANAFGPTSQVPSAFAASPPVSAFAPVNGTLNPAANVFKPNATGKTSIGFFTPAPATTTPFNAPTQSPVSQQSSVEALPGSVFPPQTSSPPVASTSPQSAFQLGPPELAPKPIFKASQVAPGGLFQPQTSSVAFPGSGSLQNSTQPPTSTSFAASQPIFDQASQAPSAGLFQPTTSSLSLPPSSTPSPSLFQSTGAVTTTNSPSGGSIFESYKVQNKFPSNFFSVPSGTPNDYEEDDDDAYSVPAPIPTGTCNSLFSRISTPPAPDLFTQPPMIAPKSVPSFIPASPFSPSSSSTSFTAPVSSTPSTAFVASTPHTTQQPALVQKPLLSRGAVWDFANSLFDDIISKEVVRTVQDAIEEDKTQIVDAVATEKYEESERLVARKLALDVAAEQFYAMRSGARFFYLWKRRARKLMLRRRGEERRRNPPAPTPVQWRPVKIPDAAFEGPFEDIQHINDLTYRSVPLKEIFQPKVEAAFWPTGEGDRKWRLLLNSSNGKEDINNYWWIEKMIGHGQPRIAMSKKGTFEAQFKLTDANVEAREVGGFIFGCSADYSISNQERFARDKTNLHAAVDWLANMTEFKKLAIMVVCYRSPMDTEDADPYGRDMGRTSGPGRRGRIAAVSCQPEGVLVRLTLCE